MQQIGAGEEQHDLLPKEDSGPMQPQHPEIGGPTDDMMHVAYKTQEFAPAGPPRSLQASTNEPRVGTGLPFAFPSLPKAAASKRRESAMREELRPQPRQEPAKEASPHQVSGVNVAVEQPSLPCEGTEEFLSLESLLDSSVGSKKLQFAEPTQDVDLRSLLIVPDGIDLFEEEEPPPPQFRPGLPPHGPPPPAATPGARHALVSIQKLKRRKSRCKRLATIMLGRTAKTEQIVEQYDSEPEDEYQRRGSSKDGTQTKQLLRGLDNVLLSPFAMELLRKKARQEKAEGFQPVAAMSAIARKYYWPIVDVYQRWKEFSSFGGGSDGTLSIPEFTAVVRQIYSFEDQLPKHLLKGRLFATSGEDPWNTCDPNEDSRIGFEEFFVWRMNTAFDEDLLMPDEQERFLRNLAHETRIPYADIEKAKSMFERFDETKRGKLVQKEFAQVLMALHGEDAAPMDREMNSLVNRYFMEADVNRNGAISFEEFVAWRLRKCEQRQSTKGWRLCKISLRSSKVAG